MQDQTLSDRLRAAARDRDFAGADPHGDAALMRKAAAELERLSARGVGGEGVRQLDDRDPAPDLDRRILGEERMGLVQATCSSSMVFVRTVRPRRG
jgi:hypothetical protein